MINVMQQLASIGEEAEVAGKKNEFAYMLVLYFQNPFGRQDMERELWLALYRLVRDLGASPWFAVTKFFRLGDRGRLPLGGGARSTYKLGV